MLLTIFKYLWILPFVILYILWTVTGVKQFIRWTRIKKDAKAEAFWQNDYICFSTWVVLHVLILFGASLTYFLAGE